MARPASDYRANGRWPNAIFCRRSYHRTPTKWPEGLPSNSPGECARRVRQIAAGHLTAANRGSR